MAFTKVEGMLSGYPSILATVSYVITLQSIESFWIELDREQPYRNRYYLETFYHGMRMSKDLLEKMARSCERANIMSAVPITLHNATDGF